MNHIGEDAELYALGVLSPHERAAADAHIAGCDACAQRVGEAEDAILATITPAGPSADLDARVNVALRPRRAPTVPAWTSIAAAFAAGVLLTAMLSRAIFPPPDATDPQLVAALVTSHFAHVPFVAVAPGAPKAKMLYGRAAAGWIYVVAQTHKAYVLEATGQAGNVRLGTLHVRGESAQLFVPSSAARDYGLFDGTTEIAKVTLPDRRSRR